MENQNPEKIQPQDAPESPVQPIEQESRFNFLKSKWAKIGLLLLFLTIVPVGTYFLGKNSEPKLPQQAIVSPTPSLTPDPTADWETYNAPSFSIKYSPDISINKKALGSPGDSFFATTSAEREFFSISTEDSGLWPDTNLDEFLQSKINFGIEKERYYRSDYIGKTKIGGKETLIFSTSKPIHPDEPIGTVLPPYKSYAIYSKSKLNGEDAVRITRIEYFANKNNADIFEKMISTFKFTK